MESGGSREAAKPLLLVITGLPFFTVSDVVCVERVEVLVLEMTYLFFLLYCFWTVDQAEA